MELPVYYTFSDFEKNYNIKLKLENYDFIILK